MIIVAYRESAKGLPPGPVANLAISMIEQRRELSKSLATLATAPEAGVPIEIDADRGPGFGEPIATGVDDEAGLLELMARVEDADFEGLTELAGAVLSLSSEAAETLAAEASGAKKRATWARDHLDLMSLA